MGEKYNYSIEELRKICIKKNYRSFYLDLIPRRFGTHMVKLLMNTNVTPNHITTISLVIGILSCFLFALGKWEYLIIGGILYPFAKCFDCTDGQLARLKGVSSKLGQLYDNIVDELITSLTYLCIGYGIFSITGNSLALLIAFIALFSHHNMSFLPFFQGATKTIDEIKKHKNFIQKPKQGFKKLLTYDCTIPYLLIAFGAITNTLYYILMLLIVINLGYFFAGISLIVKRESDKKSDNIVL